MPQDHGPGLYQPQWEHDACGVGFIAHIQGQRTHSIVADALTLLSNLHHRGGCGADSRTGDGAGILIQMPDVWMRQAAAQARIALAEGSTFGAGLVFLPHAPALQARIFDIASSVAERWGCKFLGARPVPVRLDAIGTTAQACAPNFSHVFFSCPQAARSQADKALYFVRKQWETQVMQTLRLDDDAFYITQLSTQALIYKGMLTGTQLGAFYPELHDPQVVSALGLVHQRFSTNTFPSWALAHPYRYVAHNGEINTLRGNVNGLRARQSVASRRHPDIYPTLPVVRDGDSDTASFDHALEWLHMQGRALPHAMLMMIPEPWETRHDMPADQRDFYAYHATLMEPWDGPAAMCFTDGRTIGAMLDRNGLRPLRYVVTDDGRVVMASEVGALGDDFENIIISDRLRPGKMLLVDTETGTIVGDDAIKATLASQAPYGAWMRASQITLEDVPERSPPAPLDAAALLRAQLTHGYTREDLRLILAPMATDGQEPMGSMGTDTPVAAIAMGPRLLFDYFAQLFAQVTNPPLDALREALVTSLTTYLGPQGDVLGIDPALPVHLRLTSPFLTDAQMAAVGALQQEGLRATYVPLFFDPQGEEALAQSIDALRRKCVSQVAAGDTLLILTDRDANATQVPIPSLLAVSAVHNHLVAQGLRTQCGLVVQASDAREVHHMALLLGFGANAIHPTLALDCLAAWPQWGSLPHPAPKAISQYFKALEKGLLKVMSKMGISTLQSYCGAQIFECLGLSQRVVDEYFTWTTARLGGATLATLAEHVRARHHQAWASPAPAEAQEEAARLPAGGEYQWRRDGAYHLFNPQTVFKLQHATRSGQYNIFKEYSRLVDDDAQHKGALRHLLAFRFAPKPLAIESVESVESIVKRFATGAMSFGSISQEAHETLAIAMNRLGGSSNSGEGGEHPDRFTPDANGDSRRSAIKQIASGRFGVTSHYLVNADDLQIKMAQGAKPGEGGQLPGHKVYPWIAEVRNSTVGVGLISPPPHHDIYSIEDLAQLIFDLKNANPKARINVKLVAEAGVGTVAAGVAKAQADVVLISGHDGGTGAAPLGSIKHSGIPWEIGLAETQQVLLRNNLRNRVVVQVDGQLKTGRDVVVAALLGAEEFGFATAPLIVSGCVMMRVCHLNTCPVGVATQDPVLRQRFTGKPEFVENFFRFIAQEVREWMARLGFATINAMVGATDRLVVDSDAQARQGLDLTPLLAGAHSTSERRATISQQHGLDTTLDAQLIDQLRVPLQEGTPHTTRVAVRNKDRAVGTMLGSEITRAHGSRGLPDDTIEVQCVGYAGQSFGAFIPAGLTLLLEGAANDGFGKGLSGGRIAVFPPARSPMHPHTQVIIGNAALYGATAGEAFIRGIAGERFAVRNSGAHAVVEGVGDHGCEYMTGGRVLVLGAVGRNFGAGMSGGIAYVWDRDKALAAHTNHAMVWLQPLDDHDCDTVQYLLQRHVAATCSAQAADLLSLWPQARSTFVRVMPKDYLESLQATHTAPPPRRARTGVVHG